MGPLVGIGEDTVELVVIYSTVLLFQINGLPTAILRLAGRFRLVAYGSIVGGIARLVLCSVGLLAGAGLLYFVVAWTVSQALGSARSAQPGSPGNPATGGARLLSAPLKGVTKRFKGLLSFTIGSNVELTVRSSASEFDTLLVGAFTDPAGAGLYHIAKRLGRVVLQIGVQVQAVLYPDVARLWAQGALGEFRRTVLQTEIMLAAFGFAMVAGTVLAVQPVLDWAVGAEFAAAGPLAMVQMVAVAITLSGSALRPRFSRWAGNWSSSNCVRVHVDVSRNRADDDTVDWSNGREYCQCDDGRRRAGGPAVGSTATPSGSADARRFDADVFEFGMREKCGGFPDLKTSR